MVVYVIKTSWNYDKVGSIESEVSGAFLDKDKAIAKAQSIVKEEIENLKDFRHDDYELSNNGCFLTWGNEDWFESFVYEVELTE